ncbi:adenylyl-sulfate kinase [Nocardioides ochotonae]|uniref:adenylyl-sulfate kinase n=1 Tax=Nocardioides ochotonae TaxID=2685869 RepID=UPI001CD1AC0F|nr:adenylyl-sulfate kinase [Nocardioides ochotonae]
MSTPPLPQFCPTARELDDLELLVTGALSPTTAFNQPGSPVTLTLPGDVEAAATEAGGVELVDPEGLPLARVTVPGGQVEPLTHAQFGPFRRLYLAPATVRQQYADRTFVPVTDALTLAQLDTLRAAGPVALLALVGHGTPLLSPVALLRATLRAADLLDDAVVVAVPLAARGDAAVDHELGLQVVATYAGPDRVLGLSDDDGDLPAGVAEIVDRDQPPADRQGLVLFFTGLSGSGKSTLARALMDRLLEQGTRTVTSLDGDVVRRNLSAGLSFSKADRETNIRRIGWVAAEISRHGGVAVCSPIAPFDETRQQVRGMVEEAGGAFFLVHVATPLEECERRDRKGLYAKARRGEIPEFTGISSPYEVPADADVVVDTTGRTIDAALADVLAALRTSGHLDLTDPGVEPVETPSADHLKVLFVCTANICRSPFMERLARHLAGPDASVTFTSAGTHGFPEHPMDEVMATTFGPRGVVDHDTFRSRPLTRELLDEHDLVLTAEAAHRAFILDDHPALFRKVFTLGQFDEAVRTVGAGLTGRKLLTAVAEQRGTASADLDVADPYRRGPDAAETAAAVIEAHLRHIVPALTGAEPRA